MKQIFIVLAAALLGACTQIDTGNVGVESTMGQYKPEVLQPGVYATIFKTVTEVTTKEVPLQLNDLKPQTSDKITLADLDMDVYVKTAPDKASLMVTKWSGDLTEVGKDGAKAVGLNYVLRQAREAVYDVVSRQNSATVHTQRVAIAAEVAKLLQASLDSEAGKGLFTVLSVNVRNLVTDPTLEANIKAAANAQFALQKAENEAKVAQKQAQVQNDLALQAEENALKVAKVQAERKRTEAQAEAEAIRIKAEAISKNGGDEYVRLQAIAKWNGVMPTTMPPNGSTPFVHVGK